GEGGSSKRLLIGYNSPLPKHGKLFLVDRIKDHPLWKSETFWKEAFCDSLNQEFKKYPKLEEWHSKQEQKEAERRNNEITFSQLAAITHNMKEFGMQNNTIVGFLDSQNISTDKKLMLKATLGMSDEIIPKIPALPVPAATIPSAQVTIDSTPMESQTQAQVQAQIQVQVQEQIRVQAQVQTLVQTQAQTQTQPQALSFGDENNGWVIAGVTNGIESNRVVILDDSFDSDGMEILADPSS
ncbi:putative RTX-family protein-27, partial [Reticulomyxa filosa]